MVKQPGQVSHLAIGDIIKAFHFLAVNRKNRTITLSEFHGIGIHIVDTMKQFHHNVFLSKLCLYFPTDFFVVNPFPKS